MQTAAAADSPSEAPRRLGEAVLGPLAGAVPWRAQNANEARTTRTLDALVPGDAVPVPGVADGARRRLVDARLRVEAATRREL